MKTQYPAVTTEDILYSVMEEKSAVKTYNEQGEETGYFVKVNGVYKFWNI